MSLCLVSREWRGILWVLLTTYARRQVLVNSIYSSMPTFYLYALKFPSKILKGIDKYRKYCLWYGGDISKNVVAWKYACRSKKEGGLGIINLRTRNSALLLKFLHKFACVMV